MEKRDLDLIFDIIDNEIKKSGISRREAIKMATLASTTFLLGASNANGETSTKSNSKGHIVIVGGGLAGISTASRLVRELSNPNITIIEPNSISASFQPGQTLVASGVWQKSDIIYNTKDFIPEGVKWIKERVVEFDPDNKKVKTDKGQEISYDFMIIATGLVLDYGKIEGLQGVITSLGEDSAVSKKVGKNGISSLYFADGSVKTWEQMKQFIAKAKSGKRVKALFTHPDTPIKSIGTPKEVIYLTDARLKEAKVRDNAELIFYTDEAKMFDIPEYHKAIVEQFKARNFKWHYRHNLIAVDSDKKIATFNKETIEKGAWDPDLEENIPIIKKSKVEVPFDFIHITPPMKTPDEIAKSPIASAKGWVPVVKETLQHIKFPDIFALGDVIDVPMGKTGGSVRREYKIVVDNLISHINGKPLKSKYDGYSVAPIITGLGSVMLAEFNWSKKPIPSFPLDPTKERWIWWLLKIYLLKPMVIYGMLSGRV